MPVRAFAKRVISEVLRTLFLGIGCLSEAGTCFEYRFQRLGSDSLFFDRRLPPVE